MARYASSIGLVLLLGLACRVAFAAPPVEEQDWSEARYFPSGTRIFSNGYSDQPYVVVLPDGAWLCVFTTGAGHEGAGGQHIVATRSQDEGKTWSDPVKVEPETGPPASWAMPYLTTFGRVYVFYDYNGDRIDRFPGGKRKLRDDMLGWYCYKYSDDGGKTVVRAIPVAGSHDSLRSCQSVGRRSSGHVGHRQAATTTGRQHDLRLHQAGQVHAG